jgi:hypothetical protein
MFADTTCSELLTTGAPYGRSGEIDFEACRVLCTRLHGREIRKLVVILSCSYSFSIPRFTGVVPFDFDSGGAGVALFVGRFPCGLGLESLRRIFVPEAAAMNPIAIAPQKSFTVIFMRNWVSERRDNKIVTIELSNAVVAKESPDFPLKVPALV